MSHKLAIEGGPKAVTNNLPAWPQDLTYTFTAEEVETFNTYLRNGDNVALGFDPDCHFYNNGVSLALCYSVVPEPACAVVIVLGAVASILRRRRP